MVISTVEQSHQYMVPVAAIQVIIGTNTVALVLALIATISALVVRKRTLAFIVFAF